MSAWEKAKKLHECPVSESNLQEDHGSKTLQSFKDKLADLSLWQAFGKDFEGVAKAIDSFDPKTGTATSAKTYGALVGAWRHLLENIVAADDEAASADHPLTRKGK